jgi:hypothetical protein
LSKERLEHFFIFTEIDWVFKAWTYATIGFKYSLPSYEIFVEVSLPQPIIWQSKFLEKMAFLKKFLTFPNIVDNVYDITLNLKFYPT